jgi:hypothetical protein
MSIAAATICVPQQTWAQLTYNYVGNEIFQNFSPFASEGIITGSVTFNVPVGFTGQAIGASCTLTAIGQTIVLPNCSSQNGGADNFTFNNGQITQWSLVVPAATIAITTQSGGHFGEPGGAGPPIFEDVVGTYSNPPCSPSGCGNTNDPGTWTVASTTPPPVAVNESAATTQNIPISIDLTTGASGNPTSAAQVGTAVGGSVTGFPATTVTFTPTTGFTGTGSFQFSLANVGGPSNTAMASIMVGPSMTSPDIIFNGAKKITGTTSTNPVQVVVGQQIRLSAMPPGQPLSWTLSDSTSNLSWVQKAVGGFMPLSTCLSAPPYGSSPPPPQPPFPDCTGMATPLTVSGFTTTAMTPPFYWVWPGIYTVTYNYVGGSPVTATFKVEGPSSTTVDVTAGSVKIDLDHPRQLEFQGPTLAIPPYRNGIVLRPHVTAPKDYNGQFQWVQIILEDSWVYDYLNNPTPPCDVGSGLDTYYPYNNVLPADGTEVDSPILAPNSAHSTVDWMFRAITYLMWQPNVSGTTIPVPLGTVSWGFHADGERFLVLFWRSTSSMLLPNNKQPQFIPSDPSVLQTDTLYPKWQNMVAGGTKSCP